MRLLIPILLLAGLGVGYLAFRRDAVPTSTGTGPANREATVNAPRAPLELERGPTEVSRTAAPAGEETPAAALPGAGTVVAAPEVVGPEPSKEPTFVDGVTLDAVGTKPLVADKQYYVDKYRDSSRATRVQAFESLRAAVDLELEAGSKNSAELAAEMKREMEWLQENYEPETP